MENDSDGVDENQSPPQDRLPATRSLRRVNIVYTDGKEEVFGFFWQEDADIFYEQVAGNPLVASRKKF